MYIVDYNGCAKSVIHENGGKQSMKHKIRPSGNDLS